MPSMCPWCGNVPHPISKPPPVVQRRTDPLYPGACVTCGGREVVFSEQAGYRVCTCAAPAPNKETGDA